MAVSVPQHRLTSPFANLLKSKTKDKNDVVDDVVDDDGTDDGTDDEESKKAKKLKKAKRKVEEDEDSKDEADAGTRAIRLREKSRIKAIVNCQAGLANPAGALRLALSSTMPRHAAIKLLVSMAENVPQGRDNLRDRMMGLPGINVGVGGETQSSATLAQQIIAAGAKRRGDKV